MIYKNDGSDPTTFTFRKFHKNDPNSPTKFAIVSTEEGTAQAERAIYGILRFDVFDNEKARLEISERGFVNLSKKGARLLAEALLEWVEK